MPSSGQLMERTVQPAAGPEGLPAGYGVTMAALVPRDPNWMFAYWEITGASRTELLRAHGGNIFEEGRQVLRVYDMSSPEAGRKCLDLQVLFEAGSWYVHVPEGGRPYCCELGLALPDGAFIGIVKTNTVNLPQNRVSDVVDGKWMAVTADFDKLLQLSGVEYIGKGSGEVAKSLAQRWEMLRSVFSRASSWGISSLAPRAEHGPSEKAFRLAADCELIVYGATEPDAFVTVSGRKIKLNPDGTFSLRFALPDGDMALPVEAASADGADRRRVGLAITRKTS